MASMRPFLFMMTLLLAFMLWTTWQRDYAPKPSSPQASQETAAEIPNDQPTVPGTAATDNSIPDNSIPPVSSSQGLPVVATATAESSTQAELITVTTDVLKVAIDLHGGTIVSAELLDYPIEQGQADNPVTIMERQNGSFYVAQSGLISQQAAPNHTSPYSSPQSAYQMRNGEVLEVPLSWQDKGIRVRKVFRFSPGNYAIQVEHGLENNSAQAWSGARYEQLQRSISINKANGLNNPERYSFNGGAFYTPENKFEKIKFDDFNEKQLDQTVSGGWIAFIQHYFFTAWIPPTTQPNYFSNQELASANGPRYLLRMVSPQAQVPAGGSHRFSSQLYVGPKLQDHLDQVAPGLAYTVNYGVFTIFSKPLFWLLSKIHSVVGNWGWAIIILTLLIKLAFFKLSEAQYRSMARMRKLTPRVEALKERYGSDRQRMSQEMMKLYKTEKVNPLGGCLPILVQIPIFIALYWVLIESVELRQAPFMGWIQNLSVRDPYFVLPALNAVFMILTQKLSPTTGMDPMQAKIMQAMPVVFSVLFAFFPAGLVLYWATNAGLSLLQQWYITSKIEAEA